MTKLLNKLDKLELVAVIVKGITGVIGGSLIINEGHPYLAITVLALGAAANEYLTFMQRKINKSNVSNS